MFISTTQPQLVWDENLRPPTSVFDLESHLRKEGIAQLNQLTQHDLHAAFAQLHRQRQYSRYQQLQKHKTEDGYSDYYHNFDLESFATPPPTAVAPMSGRLPSQPVHVSGAPVGRDPIHTQHLDKGSSGGNNFPWSPTAMNTAGASTMYSHSFNGGTDPRQHSFEMPDTAYSFLGFNNGIDYCDGLPSSSDAISSSHVSPAATHNSSFSSSFGTVGSDVFGPMNVDPVPTAAYHATTPPMQTHTKIIPSPFDYPSYGVTCEAALANPEMGYVSPKDLRKHPSPTPTPAFNSSTESLAAPNCSFEAEPESHIVLPSMSMRLNAKAKGRKELPMPMKRRPSPSRPPIPLARSTVSPSSPSSSTSSKAPTSVSSPTVETRVTTVLAHYNNQFNEQQPEDEESDSEVAKANAERARKDDFLVQSKRAGMTYREIRRKGNFTEAESTLRGRYRTLTKDKNARVRKPEFLDHDIILLKKAVRELAKGDIFDDKPRIPWKQVAEYIANNDGSYHFGNATCRKKWDELVARGEADL
ncbi:uncharacterized protein PG998_010753 [Apiospora kogelbergensis]|uniref:uncharacterized protein n=1 Tax=Apiospora kogelbergensis TaxID=1337665 RepID=UPI003131D8C5